ncbi:MAG: Na+/H+ antiporter NhaA [bacterium]|nr:Na+/H+ antiporter NhaA [bacterium]
MAHGKSENNSGIQSVFSWFVHSEVAGSVLLLACTIVALVWANSPWADVYDNLLHTYVGVSWGDTAFKLSLHHWINDGLMVIFFFVVGLEIKREVVVGQLSDVRKAILPVAAAAGGMVVPAVFYAIFNAGGDGAAGWGIPMATDIAFALGILALFGSRAPIGLKVFLTALAIADDLGAVLVIAVFYTEKIHLGALIVAGVLLAVLGALNVFRVRRLGFFIIVTLGIWVAVFSSGVHATVAGILVAFMMPVRGRIHPERFFHVTDTRLAELKASELSRDSMLDNENQMDALDDIARCAEDMRPAGLSLEHYLHPVQALLILPIFALANAGVPLGEGIFKALANPISIGIIAGLFLGKQVGISLFSWLAIKTGQAALPEGVTWGQIWGASCLAGVGFTMSLFISDLAFDDAGIIASAKVGILIASLLSGIVGFVVLSKSLPKAEE